MLERSPKTYEAIRELLKDKDGYPVEAFYQLIDLAQATEPAPTVRANAARHVWGHFKSATIAEKAAFELNSDHIAKSEVTIVEVKGAFGRSSCVMMKRVAGIAVFQRTLIRSPFHEFKPRPRVHPSIADSDRFSWRSDFLYRSRLARQNTLRPCSR
ncbi:MAG: YbgA family protein [Bacillus subtilis]|nr:YbgA family protein [Bacillus subtilis]